MTTHPSPLTIDPRTIAEACSSLIELLADCVRGARGIPGDLDSPGSYLDLADEYLAELRGIMAAVGDDH